MLLIYDVSICATRLSSKETEASPCQSVSLPTVGVHHFFAGGYKMKCTYFLHKLIAFLLRNHFGYNFSLSSDIIKRYHQRSYWLSLYTTIITDVSIWSVRHFRQYLDAVGMIENFNEQSDYADVLSELSPFIWKSSLLNFQSSIDSKLHKMRLASSFLCVLSQLNLLFHVISIHIRNPNDWCDSCWI